MNTFDVQVKINVLNQLRLLRNSTFKDKLTFLDELIQNAQRAKAKRVSITYASYEDKMVIENDGQILTDPQVLFSMSESGWDEDVKENEKPFGVGFFSVITVSDYVEIFSGKLHIIFNVANMLETNNTDIIVEELDDRYEGFKLVLHNFNIEDTYYSDIKDRISMLGKYIHELDIYFNNEVQEKKKLTEGDGSPFLLSIDEGELFKGWIGVQNGWSFEGVNIFYRGRLVTTLSNFHYLKGDLHITDKALTLKQPDRKDIINDEKYKVFLNILKTNAELLCEVSLLNGNQVDIDEHAAALSYHVNKNTVKKKMKFNVFKGNENEDIDYLKNMVTTLRKNEKGKFKSLSDYELYLREEAYKGAEDKKEYTIIEEVEHKAPKAKGVITYEAKEETTTNYTPEYIEKPEIKEDEIEEKIGEQVILEDQPTFWLRFSEVQEYEKQFNIAKHYSLKLIVARNKVEEEILSSMVDLNVLHIKELQEDIKIEANLTSSELSEKEKRALMLLDMVCRINGFKENVFLIGDLMVLKKTNIEALDKSFSEIEEEVVAIYSKTNEKVLVDRSIIDKSMLAESLETKIMIEDYKFILANLPTLVSQLAYFKFDNPSTLLERTLYELAKAS